MKTIITTNSLVVPTYTVTRTSQKANGQTTHRVHVKRHTSPITAAFAVMLVLFGLATAVALLIKLN